MHHDIVDLFAGPGGWDHGARIAGVNPDRILGIEWDADACATARAAGFHRLQADIAALEPRDFGPIVGLIGSPPCQSYSTAGKQKGRRDRNAVEYAANALAHGRDRRAEYAQLCEDPRSLLTVEPLRWALQLRPEWIVLEQVPAVLPLWQRFAEILRANGYSVEAGVVTAEQYGVPQTRKRAILVASRVRDVALPAPTHQAYDGRKHGPKAGTEHLQPYVTMAQALRWGMTARPSMTVTAGGGKTGGAEPFGNGARRSMQRELAAGDWITHQARNSGPGATRTPHPVSDPSYTIRAHGSGSHPSGVEWIPESTTRLQQPDWPLERPATTIACDPRVFQPGGHHVPGQQARNAIRVSVAEAAVLQSFPADYPWQGTKTKQYEQVGNAVPPTLAAAVLGAVDA